MKRAASGVMPAAARLRLPGAASRRRPPGGRRRSVGQSRADARGGGLPPGLVLNWPARAPAPPELSYGGRAPDRVAEGFERAHVPPPEHPVRLDEPRLLAALAPRLILDPAEVHDPVHR